MSISKEAIINTLREALPPVFTRKAVCEYLGGLFTAGALANLDSERKGPGGVLAGKAVVYERDAFLKWLSDYMDGSKKSLKQERGSI